MFRSLVTIIWELYLYLTKVIIYVKTLSKITSLYKLGDVAACRRAACVLCVVHSETAACVLCAVQSETAACVLCVVQSETAACVLCVV